MLVALGPLKHRASNVLSLGITFATGIDISDGSASRKQIKWQISYSMKDWFGPTIV